MMHAVHHRRDLAENLPGGAARRAEGAGELDQRRLRPEIVPQVRRGQDVTGRGRAAADREPGRQFRRRGVFPASGARPRRAASPRPAPRSALSLLRSYSLKARDGRWHSARPPRHRSGARPACSAGTKVASCRLPAVTSKPCTCDTGTHDEPGYQAVAASLATVQPAAARCTPCASVTHSWHVVPVGHAGDVDVHRRAPRLLVVPDRGRDAAQRAGCPGRLPARGGRGGRRGLTGRGRDWMRGGTRPRRRPRRSPPPRRPPRPAIAGSGGAGRRSGSARTRRNPRVAPRRREPARRPRPKCGPPRPR